MARIMMARAAAIKAILLSDPNRIGMGPIRTTPPTAPCRTCSNCSSVPALNVPWMSSSGLTRACIVG